MTITAPPARTRTRVQPRAPQRPVPPEVPPTRGTAPLTRGTSAPTRGSGPAERTPRTRSAASQRAYARKAQRLGVQTGARRSVLPARRAPFVLLVMALLAVGLIASLWLSTAAAADSYRLEQARLQARELTERSEQLRQEVANLQTAPELARRARDLGMVPTGEPAHLVVQPDGTVLVVGTPAAATVPAPVVPPAPATPAPSPAPSPTPPADQQAAGAQPPASTQPPVPDPEAAQDEQAAPPAAQNQPPPAGGGG